MINHRLHAVLAALFLLTPASVGAQDGEVWSLALSPGSCPREKSQVIDFTTLLGSPQSYKGQCIRVSGVAVGRTLYAAGRVPAVRDQDVPPTERLGIYGDPALLRKLGPSPQSVELIGMMSGQCEVGLYGAGYCHHVTAGSFMIVSDIVVERD